ncbi:MAG: (2Fe-2S)-binding protein [Lachnospiraceae bacterium]|nr:(2Fe-2S)-binding protein [Lachnospiraceae bacterium]
MDDEEIICPCMGTTIREIREAVKNGSDTLEAVEAATGAGTVCGACTDELAALIEKLKNE